MFKYLKTLYSSTHPTETMEFISNYSEENYQGIKRGAIISIEYEEVSPMLNTQLPLYLALNSKNSGEQKMIKCIRILPGMIFEADIDPNAEANNFYIGVTCDVKLDETNQGAYLTRDGDPRFEVINNSGVTKGKVTVIAI